MLFVKLLEFILVVAFLLTIATQIMVPLYLGTKLFPFFRRDNELKELEHKLEDVHVDAVKAQLKQEIHNVETQVEDKLNSLKGKK